MQKKKNVIICAIIVIFIIIVGFFVLRSTKFSNYINEMTGKPTSFEKAHIEKTEKDLKIPTIIDNKMENFKLLSDYTKIKIYNDLIEKTRKYQNGIMDTMKYNAYLNNFQNKLESSNLIDILGFTKTDVNDFINNNLNEAYSISQSTASEPLSFYIQYANTEIQKCQQEIDEIQSKYKISSNNQEIQNYLQTVEEIIYSK